MSADLPHITPAELNAAQARIVAQVFSDPAAAETALLENLAQAKQIGAKAQEANALLHLAGCAFLQSRYEDMLDTAHSCLVAAQEARLAPCEARALNNIGLAHQRLGDTEKSMDYLLRSLELSQIILDQDGISRCLGNIALGHSTIGDHARALQLHEQALEIGQQQGNSALVADMLTSTLQDHYYLGNDHRTLDIAIEAITFPRQHGLPRSEATARSILGMQLLKLGRITAALRTARSGMRSARWTNDLETESRLLWIEGQALTALGDYDSAEVTLLEALTTDEKLGYAEQIIDSHWALADLYRRWGKVDTAEFHWQQHQMLRDRTRHPDIVRRMQDQVTKAMPETHVPTTHPWSAELAKLTQSLKRANTEISHRASHDPLTGALTRQHFLFRLQELLDFLSADELLGVVFVDIDDFHALNASYGSSITTSLLADVRATISAAVRHPDVVGRVGSDQFAIVLVHLAQPHHMEAVMAKLARDLAQPMTIRGQPLAITVSVGGAVAPEDGESPEALVENAELASRVANRTPGVSAVRFSHEGSEDMRKQRQLRVELRDALDRNEFMLHYQGIYRVADEQIVGYEALLRWQHPHRGMVFPGEFIPACEEGRYILDVGDWVLRAACRQVADWRQLAPDITIAVNVSALQFAQPDFLTSVRSALESAAAPPAALVIEITESMMQEDLSVTQNHLAGLHEDGVQVALDDFGTGYSSLSVLQDLPVDTLKIDRSFLQRLVPGSEGFDRSQVMVDTIVRLAQSLDVQVLAEGVETPEQLEILTQLGCNKAQGYLWTRPVPPTQAQELLT